MRYIIILASVMIGIAVAGHHGGKGGGHDNAHHKFKYGVHDPHTHDHKSQHENRDGKHVTGRNLFREVDGTHRIARYKSGTHKRFEAVVEQAGYAQHPAQYDKHGKHGKYGHNHGGKRGTSYDEVTHWRNQDDGQGRHLVHGARGGHSRHGGGGKHGHKHGGDVLGHQ